MDNVSKAPIPSKENQGEILLLSSLAAFWSLMEPLLSARSPKRLCEIGIGRGEFTALLLDFCARNDCRYSGIDSSLSPELMHRLKTPQAEFFIKPSLSVLLELPPQDVYFIDGDHNYFTVLNELRLILGERDHWPLVFLHDVGWPWGRRDQYCVPAAIPPEFLQPHSSSLGVVPGRDELGAGGFSGESSDYHYAAAEHEGGPRNGVLTAIEHFLGEEGRGDWKLLKVPAVFGLGILCAPGKCTPEVAIKFGQLESAIGLLAAVLELLERNRIALFLNHLRQISDLNTLHAQYDKLALAYKGLDAHSASLQKCYEALLAHSDALLASYRELEKHTWAVQEAHDTLLQNNKPQQ